jgi:outer membrane protein assembly factor BamB
MKNKVLGVGAVALLTGLALAQNDLRVHTKPIPPSRDTLDRLDLKMAWRTTVPLDGLRDGFFSLQLIPGKDFTLLLAQTYQGATIAMNADTGDALWRTTLGRPYEATQLAGYNSQAVFCVRREYLYILDRDTGAHFLYSFEPGTKRPVNGLEMESAASAGLLADEEALYMPYSDRVTRYGIPNFRVAFKSLERPFKKDVKEEDLPTVVRQGTFNTLGGTILQPPVLTGQKLIIPTASGTIYGVDKLDMETSVKFRTEGELVGGIAISKGVLYVASSDYFAYALDTTRGQMLWRFAVQSAVATRPHADDRDVYITAAKGGLHRLDRLTGKVHWSNADAFRVLAVNQRFVYAMDRQGKFMVLDYDRGKELARWDTRDWVVPVSNELNDRIYLASNDGQIVCLHHRDNAKPFFVRTFEEAKQPPPKDKEDDKKPKDKGKDMDDGKDKDGMEKNGKDKDGKEKVRFEGWRLRGAIPEAGPAHRAVGVSAAPSQQRLPRELRLL